MHASEAYILPVSMVIREQKAQRFVARVTEADKQLFQRAANIEGRSMATFVVAHAREVAIRIVSRNNQIQLDAEQSARFVDALLAPSRKATASMKDSIRAYRKSVTSDLD